MIANIKEWLSNRWPFSSVFKILTEEEIRGGASFFYTFGSTIFIVFTIQAVTGIMELFYYVPSVQDAYTSVGYLHTKVPFGWLIHGLHFWGAQVIIVLVLVHIVRVFLWGAYKRPRELTWLAGVTLLLTLMVFSFTGATLPWDQKGYWVGQVSTSIPGVMPVVGELQKVFLRGGEDMGQLTITRFFGLHVAILPLALVALFGFHIIAMRRFGISGPWKEERRKTVGHFWPDQVLKDAVSGTLAFLIILTLVVFVPYEFRGPADLLDTTFVPKPDWNFLFLYEALKYFEGPLEPVGAAGVPGLLVALLVLLPFIDRNPERNPFRRPVAMFSGLALAAILVALTIAGYKSPGYGGAAAASAQATAKQEKFEDKQAPAVADQPMQRTKEKESVGDAIPPLPSPLEGEDPQEVGEAAFIIGNVDRGKDVFDSKCGSCHGREGRGGLPNPGSDDGMVPALYPIEPAFMSEDPEEFAKNIDRFIQHGSVPAGSPALTMPAFGASNVLTQQQIANVIAYIMRMNGFDRALILNPGIAPMTFYAIVISLFILAGLTLAGFWSRRSSSSSREANKEETGNGPSGN